MRFESPESMFEKCKKLSDNIGDISALPHGFTNIYNFFKISVNINYIKIIITIIILSIILKTFSRFDNL